MRANEVIAVVKQIKTEEVNRLEEPVITGISDWLNINQYTYDYGKVCILKDRIASNITPDMTVLQIYRVIRDEITAWRKDPKTADAVIVDFRAWCELHRTLSSTLEKSFRMEIADQVLAVRNRIHRDEAFRHAS
ncbi:hypothetical protein [Endozoicomonas sp. YOMI1]|uniref:hypothetical protein n=1 Tax=Endozoicomonas sp. YOMI1 TaxID=2828739 RepID=UPI0021479D10|nr:hypothetical protein [Endozoicomonas sp. YOMI1]